MCNVFVSDDYIRGSVRQSSNMMVKKKKEKEREEKRGENDDELAVQTRSLTHTYGYVFNSFSFLFVAHLFNEMREECISCDRNTREREKKSSLSSFSNTYADVFFSSFFVLKNWTSTNQIDCSVNSDWSVDQRRRAIILIDLFETNCS